MRAGIDLGTTFSLAAWLDAGAPALIPDCSEPRVFRTPSVVHLSGGSALVGGRAEELLEEDPRVPLIRFFKRRLGQCRPVFHDDGAAAWSAEGVSALLLRKLAFDAEVHSGSPLQQAVIAVPAHFTDPQRRALLGAASLADLDVLGLVEAPVAAALHYGAARDMSDEVVLVYDFGGGGLDTTVLTMDPHGVHTLGKTGLADAGGKELDEQVADRVLSELERVPGRSFPKDAEALAHLRRIAEEFKIELCASGRSRVRRTVEWDGRAVEVEIARADFESAIRDLVSRTEAEALACLWDTGLRPRDVTRVLLVGGCSQIPLVEQRLRGLFGGAGQEVLRHEPIRAVAYGAAMHAGQLASEADRHGLPPVLGGGHRPRRGDPHARCRDHERRHRRPRQEEHPAARARDCDLLHEPTVSGAPPPGRRAVPPAG